MIVRICLPAYRNKAGWILCKVVEDTLHLIKERTGHLPGKPVSNKNALDHQVFTVGRHGISRNKPAAFTQFVGKIVEGKACVFRVQQFPAQARNAALAVVDDPEWTERRNLFCQIAAEGITLGLNLAVTLFAESQKIIVLADNLAAGS